MGKFSQILNQHPLIGLDTPVFIYHLESNPQFKSLAAEIFRRVESGQTPAVSSVITLMEITTLPYRAGQPAYARRVEALLADFPNLRFIPIDREVARLAARLRAEYNLGAADSLQIAACKYAGASAFVTNDKRLARVDKFMRVVVMSDYLEAE